MWLDSVIEAAGRSLSDLRAADRRYDDLEGSVFVFADASSQRGTCFAVSVERIERGLTEEEARLDLSTITHRFAEPYGALVPHGCLDLVLGSAVRPEELALAQTWLLSHSSAPSVHDRARMIAITSGMMALTLVTEAIPTLDCTPAELLAPVPRTPLTFPRIPERVTGDRAPVDVRRRYPAWGPLQSYDGDLLSRAEGLLEEAQARQASDRPPVAILLGYACSDPGNTIAATWLSRTRGIPRDELRARLRALDDQSLELLMRPLVFGRLLPRPTVTDLIEQACGPVMASVIAMWVEKVTPEITPIVALGHESLLLATEAPQAQG